MLRVRRAFWLVLGMLSLSLLLVVLGIYTTTITESVIVTGYSSGVIVSVLVSLMCWFLCESRVTADDPDHAWFVAPSGKDLNIPSMWCSLWN